MSFSDRFIKPYTAPMRILGIDPGLKTIGLGWVSADSPHSVQAEDWCTIETESDLSLADRLAEISDDLSQMLDELQPSFAVIERLFFAVNAKSAIEVAHARGVILATLAKRGIPVLEPTPLALKRAITGDGQADKRQVQDMLVRCLKLSERPNPVDAADALALAYYGALQGHTLMLASATPASRSTR